MSALDLGTPRILAEVRDGVGWITFNHPERRNAMSLDMWQGLGIAAEAFERDPAVRAVVMHGAGGKAFVSGADISEFEQHRADAAQKKTYDEIAARGHAGLAALSKPLIAMIDGYCVGGGLAIALAADVRFASASSRFAIPAARLGLGYDYRGVAALARLVGPSVAKDILFSARFLEAEEALRVGLVNGVVEGGQLGEHVAAYAAQIAANAPLTVHAAKQALRAFEHYSDGAPGADAVAALVLRCFDSDDYREGRRAFLAKRQPQFQGR
ncbi:enoyl-CoA hydratase/carnithine racemase [Acidovorax soli]|uniref:Enoyl-CoA hydratase/carnithine racemase n=1 Tax=Acidovorax soli TaxID=592050 RepID=A0A7X0UC73_9BURK|nr:enoyl-CoA hydratase [Acidovorax soli]MBB6563101.1 enoyl-CoA hydratase/carnithine racemase [Acidovorax soli]